MKNSKIKEMTLIAIMGGLGAILMLVFHTPIPFMPPFMDFDLAAIPELIGGFALGPVAAICIILVKIFVKFLLMGTSSMFTGEIQNFILSCAYVLPAVLIYQKNKKKKSALIGMGVGTIVCAITAVFTNLYIIIPFFANLAGMSTQQIIDGCTAVNPMMKDALTLAIFGIIPFNIIKGVASSLVTYILYKRLSGAIKNFVRE